MAKTGFYSDGYYRNSDSIVAVNSNLGADYIIIAKSIDDERVRVYSQNSGEVNTGLSLQVNAFKVQGGLFSGNFDGINISGGLTGFPSGETKWITKHSSVSATNFYYNGYLANGVSDGTVGESGKIYKNGRLYTGFVPAATFLNAGVDSFGYSLWSCTDDSIMGYNAPVKGSVNRARYARNGVFTNGIFGGKLFSTITEDNTNIDYDGCIAIEGESLILNNIYYTIGANNLPLLTSGICNLAGQLGALYKNGRLYTGYVVNEIPSNGVYEANSNLLNKIGREILLTLNPANWTNYNNSAPNGNYDNGHFYFNGQPATGEALNKIWFEGVFDSNSGEVLSTITRNGHAVNRLYVNGLPFTGKKSLIGGTLTFGNNTVRLAPNEINGDVQIANGVLNHGFIGGREWSYGIPVSTAGQQDKTFKFIDGLLANKDGFVNGVDDYSDSVNI